MSHWDKILASQPLNTEAAVVTSEGWESETRSQAWRDRNPYWQEVPHELKPHPNTPQLPDIAGQRVGRLVVQGMMAGAKSNATGGSLWSVRCDCGAYTARRFKYLTREFVKEPMCDRCDYHEGIKQGHSRAALDNSDKKRVRTIEPPKPRPKRELGGFTAAIQKIIEEDAA